jgi:inorganic triphosphatase YgiF
MQAVAAHPRLAQLRLAPPQTAALVSVYHDTADHRLGAAKIALRLRRVGRRWVQTVKRKGEAGEGGGLFAHDEDERPAPGGRLVLDGDDPDGALAAVREAAGDAALGPIFETRVERTTERLGLPGLGEVELALDAGEIRAGEATEPIREVEFELKSGGVAAIFAAARQILDETPFRLGTTNKAARGYRLLREGAAEAPKPRKAGSFDFGPETGIEMVARDVLRDCLRQISANIPVVLDTDASEGPHQLRIGLRRLRTALKVFEDTLGGDRVLLLEAAAQRLGQEVGHLRDADVLMEEVVAHAAERGLDPESRALLDAALATRREAVRAEVRTALAGPATGAFLLDLLEFVETRGWLEPSDYDQTARLARPIGEMAPKLLRKRWRKVKALGEDIRELEPEELHSLRKALKKLRYTVDMLIGLYPGKRSAAFLAALKDLQDSFGSLNDAAMAEARLAGPDAVEPDDPAVQRAVGFTLGILAGASATQRPEVFSRWDELAETKPFWT